MMLMAIRGYSDYEKVFTELNNLQTGDWVSYIMPLTAEAYKVTRIGNWLKLDNAQSTDSDKIHFDISELGVNMYAVKSSYNEASGFIRPLNYIDKDEINKFKTLVFSHRDHIINQSLVKVGSYGI